jgi:membrane-associated HD superfamily phosphohydrolase
LNLIVALLNITIFTLLILAIVMIINKVNSPSYNPEDVNLAGIIFLVTLSITLSLGIIICSFFLISIKNKNKFKIYQKIYLDLNDLLINYKGQDVDAEIKKIIDRNLIFKKEKLFKSLKAFVSEDKIK